MIELRFFKTRSDETEATFSQNTLEEQSEVSSPSYKEDATPSPSSVKEKSTRLKPKVSFLRLSSLDHRETLLPAYGEIIFFNFMLTCRHFDTGRQEICERNNSTISLMIMTETNNDLSHS